MKRGGPKTRWTADASFIRTVCVTLPTDFDHSAPRRVNTNPVTARGEPAMALRDHRKSDLPRPVGTKRPKTQKLVGATARSGGGWSRRIGYTGTMPTSHGPSRSFSGRCFCSSSRPPRRTLIGGGSPDPDPDSAVEAPPDRDGFSSLTRSDPTNNRALLYLVRTTLVLCSDRLEPRIRFPKK